MSRMFDFLFRYLVSCEVFLSVISLFFIVGPVLKLKRPSNSDPEDPCHSWLAPNAGKVVLLFIRSRIGFDKLC